MQLYGIKYSSLVQIDKLYGITYFYPILIFLNGTIWSIDRTLLRDRVDQGFKKKGTLQSSYQMQFCVIPRIHHFGEESAYPFSGDTVGVQKVMWNPNKSII